MWPWAGFQPDGYGHRCYFSPTDMAHCYPYNGASRSPIQHSAEDIFSLGDDKSTKAGVPLHLHERAAGGLRAAVEMHLLNSVSQAATLYLRCNVQEHLSEKLKTKQMRPSYSKTNASTVNKYGGKNTFAYSDLWKSRQLKEYRRLHNFFFKCGDKYTSAHKCVVTLPGQLNALYSDTIDWGGFLSNEILEMLEDPQRFIAQEHCYIPLHAISGKPKHKVV
jgi:hypothetical protein